MKHYLQVKKGGKWEFARPGYEKKPFVFDTFEQAKAYGEDFFGFRQINRWRVIADPPEAEPIVILTCDCCKVNTHGRQWWNRNKGIGICSSCAKELAQVEPYDYMHGCYGIPNIHYFLKEGE